MEARVTAQSQSFRLRQRAQEANIQHGQEARVDIPNVRVVTTAGAPAVAAPALGGRFRWLRREGTPPAERTPEPAAEPPGDVFFCNIGPIHVREVLEHGDEAPLPATVVVEGLEVPTSGSYDLVNVIVRANGDLRLVVDAETRLEPATPAWSASPF